MTRAAAAALPLLLVLVVVLGLSLVEAQSCGCQECPCAQQQQVMDSCGCGSCPCHEQLPPLPANVIEDFNEPPHGHQKSYFSAPRESREEKLSRLMGEIDANEAKLEDIQRQSRVLKEKFDSIQAIHDSLKDQIKTKQRSLDHFEDNEAATAAVRSHPIRDEMGPAIEVQKEIYDNQLERLKISHRDDSRSVRDFITDITKKSLGKTAEEQQQQQV